MESNEMPTFGNLQGVKVVAVGSAIAGPFVGTLFAEQGADVIYAESTLAPDMFRMFGDVFTVEHRNQRAIALDVPSPEGKEILARLLSGCDVLVENSKGGTWAKWGLTDEALWEINPKLVIAHISGFGQTGDPNYVKRGSYDPIGQAFSGFMAINGEPEPAPPYAVKPFTGDYFTALTAAWASVAALYRTRETGIGESIDIAQYECLARIQGNFLTEGVNFGKQPPRMGNKDLISATESIQKCKDGNYVMTGLGGAATLKRVEALWGLADDPDFAEMHTVILKKDKARAEKFVKANRDFCQSHTAEEVDRILNEHNIPCSVVMTYDMMLTNPQYQARETITEWYDPITKRMVKGVGPIPKFKNNPSQIYRGGSTYGMDNEDVLSELGFSEAEIQDFYDKKIIKK
ncbi:CoA transferase [Desulfitobacterium sp.]|uniref:CoA transferase n=1 Tax=Desulfitobacterium sp. TaxID=49981 RepID=UPI002C75AC72|nr:CoA transferase [Desulfitobacterium sp.]HVJ48684.1 CoA transferase [Desulfitobacterium sp.]